MFAAVLFKSWSYLSSCSSHLFEVQIINLIFILYVLFFSHSMNGIYFQRVKFAFTNNKIPSTKLGFEQNVAKLFRICKTKSNLLTWMINEIHIVENYFWHIAQHCCDMYPIFGSRFQPLRDICLLPLESLQKVFALHIWLTTHTIEEMGKLQLAFMMILCFHELAHIILHNILKSLKNASPPKWLVLPFKSLCISQHSNNIV